MLQGDVSNRGKTKSSSAKGRERREESEDPAEVSSINQTEEVEPVDDGKAPKRRRSLRSCVLAQSVNVEESARSSSSARSSKSGAKKAGQGEQTRGRPRKRPSEEPAAKGPAKKKARRSTSPKKKAATKNKASAASRSRQRSTSRGRAGSASVATRRSSRTASRPRKPCSAFVTQTNYELVRTPFDGSKFTLGISPYDEAAKDDVLEVSNYATDIFQRLYHAEVSETYHALRFGITACAHCVACCSYHLQEEFRSDMYMDDQEEITSTMRAILIDWLVEVHMKFRLVPATLYLCVNIIDRYCSKTSVNRRKLQLVGVTALLVACKYEEIYPPEVRDCVYITDRTYTRQEVLDMEQDIVRQLEFKMTVPTAYPFLIRFLLITKASELTKIAANYYMERTLQEYQFLQYRPSLVAASAVCLALNNTDIRTDEGKLGPCPGVVSSNRCFANIAAHSSFLRVALRCLVPSSLVPCSNTLDSTLMRLGSVLH